MTEQSFKSAGFFEGEIDQTTPEALKPVGVPAGLIGTSERGPAFVPVTIRDFEEFKVKFGDENPKYVSTYAAKHFLNSKKALTFLRVLGAGDLSDSASISKYKTTGQAKNAGFVVTGTAIAGDGRHQGSVQFITAKHTVSANEAYGMPMFSDNSTYNGVTANLVRGVLLLASGTRAMVLDGNEAVTATTFVGTNSDDVGSVSSNIFKLVLSSSDQANFGTADGIPGVRIFSASMDPSSDKYFGKLLNKDPEKFSEYQHVLYADYPVDNELAVASSVAVLSGSANTSSASGDTSMLFRDAFGHFDTTFQSPKTPWFISQPFGKKEYNLFKIEALDDGDVAKYKVSITDLVASTDVTNAYGTFSVVIRDFKDNDNNQIILERYSLCSLDPNSSNYICKKIGDKKERFVFDAENLSERRIFADGKYDNVSKRIRVVASEEVDTKQVPETSLPFGFRGLQTIKTNVSASDKPPALAVVRLSGMVTAGTSDLTGSVVPPVPYRFKVTRGEVATSGYPGNPGPTESVNSAYHWGIKFERSTDVLNSNTVIDKNYLLENLSKFSGIEKLDVLTTGSFSDSLNDNKFTLSKVAFSNTSLSDLTSSVQQHVKEAAYLRNGVVDPTSYSINDGVITGRITLATLLAQSPSTFNRFSSYAKFSTMTQGGFDGVNVLDKDAKRFGDKASSFEGAASTLYVSPGLSANQAGSSVSNNAVVAYRTAADLMTDVISSDVNILCIPGIREPYISDYVCSKTKNYGLAINIMDIETRDDSGLRVFEDSLQRPDIDQTISALSSRNIDNDYTAVYFPDVVLLDEKNNRKTRVPASVAGLSAYASNDILTQPWFAPAGFNRGSLTFVKGLVTKINQTARDSLSAARINPISLFPDQGYVIYGQKTLKASDASSLSRVNVRRLMIDAKRSTIKIASRLNFENLSMEDILKAESDIAQRMNVIKAQSGIDKVTVVMNGSNNTPESLEDLRVRGRIEIYPTKFAEFVVIDFISTRSGTQFV